MKLRHIELHTTKLAEASEFYQVLGLKVVDKGSHHVDLACDGEEGGTMRLLRFADPPNIAGGPIVHFECVDVEERYQTLSEAGMKFAFSPVTKPGGRREVGLVDPDGQLICIYQVGAAVA
jgi:catechol 2,3-dioxygenase-like lactoylglutathione lyase family enzyme